MEIKSIKSSNSFNGWRNNAKPIIIQMIKRMPKTKADKAIALVNKLETTSPHHYLDANALGFWVMPKDKFTQTKDFGLVMDPLMIFWKNPVKCLEKMQEHVNKENILIQKAGKVVETLIPKLKNKFGGQYGIFSKGFHLGHKERKIVAAKLAKLSISENGANKMEEALKMLDNIHEKAINTNFKMFPTRSGDKIVIMGYNRPRNFSIKNIKIDDDINKTLKKVEKFLDKENIKNQHYTLENNIKNLKEAFADTKNILKLKKREIRTKQIELLSDKLSNNYISNIFKKIFEKIEKKSLAKEAKIAKELKF